MRLRFSSQWHGFLHQGEYSSTEFEYLKFAHERTARRFLFNVVLLGLSVTLRIGDASDGLRVRLRDKSDPGAGGNFIAMEDAYARLRARGIPIDFSVSESIVKELENAREP